MVMPAMVRIAMIMAMGKTTAWVHPTAIAMKLDPPMVMRTALEGLMRRTTSTTFRSQENER